MRCVLKDLHYAELLELYKDLLTEHRRAVAYDYYLMDLSMGEIAENYGMTRQGVNDCLKKAREQLDEFEAKLKLYAKCELLRAQFGDVAVNIIKES